MRGAANAANKGLNTGGHPTHEIKPVNWRGSATDFANKVGMMSQKVHSEDTSYWNGFKAWFKRNGYTWFEQ